ncbi:MAG TPA: RNA methyltransferase [Planctomycetaceae bacterium]|jgi:tRNA G18 (ribose-2'-O)-methylase SpoU|nr:RNA methyltransferase [Planctomycetaceae bacterium]
MPVEILTNLDDPRLEPYRNLKATNRTRWSNQFIAEGSLVVERLLASRFQVESVLLSQRLVRQLPARVPEACPIYLLEHELAEQLVGYAFHTGVLACGLREPNPQIEDLVPRDDSFGLVAVCPHVSDPENVGAMIRLCTGFGLRGLIVGRGCADPFSRRVLRVSMGTALTLPIVESTDLRRDLLRLRDDHGFELCASVLDPRAEALETFVPGPRTGILFGNEKHGLDPRWIELCDRKLTIPMALGADSLNVAVAAGIFFHHLRLATERAKTRQPRRPDGVTGGGNPHAVNE